MRAGGSGVVQWEQLHARVLEWSLLSLCKSHIRFYSSEENVASSFSMTNWIFLSNLHHTRIPKGHWRETVSTFHLMMSQSLTVQIATSNSWQLTLSLGCKCSVSPVSTVLACGEGHMQYKERALDQHGSSGSLLIFATEPPGWQVPWSLDMISAKICLKRLWFILLSWSVPGGAADSSPIPIVFSMATIYLLKDHFLYGFRSRVIPTYHKEPWKQGPGYLSTDLMTIYFSNMANRNPEYWLQLPLPTHAAFILWYQSHVIKDLPYTWSPYQTSKQKSRKQSLCLWISPQPS